MAMTKQMVSLTNPQVVFLKQEAERLGVSVSDVVRRIIDTFREHRENELQARSRQDN